MKPVPIPADLSVDPVEPLTDAELPRCSIVILNWNGQHHLAPCFESLRKLDYPSDRFEVVLVDNGSTDGSVEEMKKSHAWVRLIENPNNVGFSAGCNQGARAARDADVLVFLNNDMHVDPRFLRELVAPIQRGACEATTGRMFSWDGKLINSAGGGMNFYGFGIQRGYMDEPGPEYDVPRLSLFPCGGAMAMDAKVFEDVGGFDEEFFAYYEDVDLGWRLWVLGHSVQYVPGAVCYHHHSSTSRRVPLERLRLLQVRNPLLACFKNYDDANLQRVLPLMLALATRRSFLCMGLENVDAYRIEHVDAPSGVGAWGRLRRRWRKAVPHKDLARREGLADLIAVNDLIGSWDRWMLLRGEIQSRRRRADENILRLFLRPMWCIEQEPGYKELHDGAADFLGITKLFEGLTSLDKDPSS